MKSESSMQPYLNQNLEGSIRDISVITQTMVSAENVEDWEKKE